MVAGAGFVQDPKIAISVYVEYGTWGSKWAAPISSVMMEYYLKRNLSQNGIKKMLDQDDEGIYLNVKLSDETKNNIKDKMISNNEYNDN